MRGFVFAATIAALLFLSLSSLAGCQRADQDATEPDVPGSAAAAGPVAAPTDTGDVPPPEGVLRAYVWSCDGGLTLSMNNLYRENAITLALPEGPRRLPLVVSASGAKYSDGSLTFWTRGNAATLERPGSAAIQCRELRAQSLLADARERGVLYRGIGNEPGWTVEVGPGQRLIFVTDYGQERHEFEAATPGADDAGTVVYVAETGSDSIRVTIDRQDCADDMSGEPFDYRMVVEHGEQSHRGCAVNLQ